LQLREDKPESWFIKILFVYRIGRADLKVSKQNFKIFLLFHAQRHSFCQSLLATETSVNWCLARLCHEIWAASPSSSFLVGTGTSTGWLVAEYFP